MIQKIKNEFAKKEFQNTLKSFALVFAMSTPLVIAWTYFSDYADYVGRMHYLEIMQWNPEHRLVIILGMLCLQWLPVYLIYRFVKRICFLIMKELDWYEDFKKYCNGKKQ